MNTEIKKPRWARNMLTRSGYCDEASLSHSNRNEETQKRLNRASIKADYQRRAAEEQKIKKIKSATASDILGPSHKLKSGKLIVVNQKVANIRLPRDLNLEEFATQKDLVSYLEEKGYSTQYWREPARSIELHNAMAFPVENIQIPVANPKQEHSAIDDDVVIDGYENF